MDLVGKLKSESWALELFQRKIHSLGDWYRVNGGCSMQSQQFKDATVFGSLLACPFSEFAMFIHMALIKVYSTL